MRVPAHGRLAPCMWYPALLHLGARQLQRASSRKACAPRSHCSLPHVRCSLPCFTRTLQLNALLHKTTGAPCMPPCSPCRQSHTALLRAAQDSCKPVRAHGEHSTMHRVSCPAASQLQRLCVWKTCAPCLLRQLPHALLATFAEPPEELSCKSTCAPQCAGAPCMP